MPPAEHTGSDAADAREMVRRYGAQQARRDLVRPLLILGGIAVGGLGAVLLKRRGASVRELSAHAWGDTKRLLSKAAEDPGARVAQLRTRAASLSEHEPLVVAALGVALGLAASAIWPASEAERRLMGPARRRVIDEARIRAGEMASAAVEQIGRAVAAVADDGTAQAEPPPAAAPQDLGKPDAAPAPRRRKSGATTRVTSAD